MVEIEKLEGGAYRVSRVLPCAASMQAAASALERVAPEAYAVPALGPSLYFPGPWPEGLKAGELIGAPAVLSVELRD